MKEKDFLLSRAPETWPDIFQETCVILVKGRELVTAHFKAQWQLYVPPALTFINPAFWSQSVSTCFV
jgi:hypothetical protein